MKNTTRFLVLALCLLSVSGCATADRDFRSRVESVSAGGQITDDGASGEVTIHLRNPAGLAK